MTGDLYQVTAVLLGVTWLLGAARNKVWWQGQAQKLNIVLLHWMCVKHYGLNNFCQNYIFFQIVLSWSIAIIRQLLISQTIHSSMTEQSMWRSTETSLERGLITGLSVYPS